MNKKVKLPVGIENFEAKRFGFLQSSDRLQDIDRFATQFGFTEGDVKQLLEYYCLEEKFETICEWYDGYRFGNTEVYCPWNVINYVDLLCAEPSDAPRAYWINTSGNDI